MGKSKTTENNAKEPSKIFSFTQNERFRMITGSFLILFGLYLLFAMISYLFTWKTDNIDWISIFSGSDIQVDNWAGKLGAFLSHTFIYRWFGLPSFGLTFLLILWGTALLGPAFLNLKKTSFITIVIIIISSLLLGFIDNLTSSFDFLLGGQHGFFIVDWLRSFLGYFGTSIVLFILTFSFIIIVSNPAFTFIAKQINRLTNKQKQDSETDNALEQNLEEDQLDQDLENEKILNLDLSSNTDEETIEDLNYHSNLDEIDEQDNPLKSAQLIEMTVKMPNGDEDDTLTSISEISDEDDALLGLDLEDEIDANDVEMDVEELTPEEEAKNLKTRLEILGEYDPKADLSHYKFPSIEILVDHEVNNTQVTAEELNENKDKIVETLANYKIEITNISATIGPSITLYEIVPAPGVRISKIKNLEDDIALSLAALGIRIIAPMPGKGTIGIEVPNKNPQIVSMRSTIASKSFQESKYELPIILGKNIYNKTYTIDLAKTPHMLVAGATGQGKSVGINAILTSLLYKKHPAELKFVLIDPKKVELSIYSRIEKHYLAKLPDEEDAIITDVQKVVATLNSLAKEMDARYDLLKNAHVRNIIEYNKKFINRRLNPDKGHKYLPYIVVVIDEFADLIMTAGKEVEHPIARIAQLARAIGIHLIVATQRPSTNVITGMIKANFPTRVAFRVTQMVDSRTILDSPGANQLIGRGDMLVSQGGGEMIRLQCPFVDTPEVEELVLHIESQQGYPTALLLPEPDAEALGITSDLDLKQRDELFDEAARLMVQTQQGSTSSIQRKFSIGYNRAGRIIDQLEGAGIVGPYEGSKARKVLFPDEYSLEQFLKTLD